MKRIIILFFLGTFFLPANSLFAQRAVPSKVAYFSLDSILDEMPEMRKATDDMAAYKANLDGQLQKMTDELERKKTELANATDLKPEVRALKEKEIEDMKANIELFEMQANTDYENYRGQLVEPIFAKIQKAAKEVALAKGYDIVLDSSIQTGVVISTNGKNNISGDIRKKLGIPLTNK